MIRTVIIDDEPRNIKLIAGIIHDHCPELKITGHTDDLAEAASLIKNLEPDLLLLDIEFPTGTIFPMLEKTALKNCQIIFITAHNTYAAEAFRQNAAGYILKPVTKEAVIQAVETARERIQYSIPAGLSKLIQSLKSELSHSRKIPLPSSDGILFVNESAIIRCEASGRYTVIHLDSKKKITVTKTLKEIESLLSPLRFYRIHHSHIINLDMIKKYHRGNGGLAELSDGSLVEVAASRKEKFLHLLLNNRNGRDSL